MYYFGTNAEDASSLNEILLTYFVIAMFVALFSFLADLLTGGRKVRRAAKLRPLIKNAAEEFCKKTSSAYLGKPSGIHIEHNLSKRMYYYSQPSRKLYLRNKETIRQLRLYVEKEEGSFDDIRDHPFIHTALDSQEVFNDNDLLTMFSIVNSSKKNRELFKNVYYLLLDYYSNQHGPTWGNEHNTNFYDMIRTENHQLYKDVKAWIDAVVEADKVNDVKPTRKNKVKSNLNAFIGRYEFKTDYSGENSFLSLPVEWQVDMILEHDEESQESITTL